MAKTWRYVTGGVCALLACAVAYSIVASRANHNALLIRDSAILIGVVDDWHRAAEPQGEVLEKLLSNYGSFKPFVYTNSVEVAGSNLVCLFAIRDDGFAEAGKLAVTRERVVVWLGDKRSRVISLGR